MAAPCESAETGALELEPRAELEQALLTALEVAGELASECEFAATKSERP